jgi:cell division initiation protein
LDTSGPRGEDALRKGAPPPAGSQRRCMPEETSVPDLARVEFSTAMRGYEKDEVDTFLRELAQEHNRVVVELAAAQRSAEKAHLELGEEIGELLQHAKDVADGMLKKATEEAAATKEVARRKAEQVGADAQRKADQLVAAAEADALARVRDAQQKVRALQETEAEVRARLQGLQETVRGLGEQIAKSASQPEVRQKILDDPAEISVLSAPSG